MNDSSLAYPLTDRAVSSSRWLPASPLFVALLLGATGCEVHTHDSSYAADDEGTLAVDWTLDDSFDPRACDDFRATDLELVIYDDRDHVVDRFRAPCDDFSADIDLLDGVYSIDATLLDRSSEDATTTVSVDGLDVYAGEDTPVHIDFPLDSIR
jgi:hypothetical protein